MKHYRLTVWRGKDARAADGGPIPSAKSDKDAVAFARSYMLTHGYSRCMVQRMELVTVAEMEASLK